MVPNRVARRVRRTLGDTLQRLAIARPEFVRAVQIAAECELRRILRRQRAAERRRQRSGPHRVR